MKKLYAAKSGIDGKGLFCRVDLKKGDTVGYVHGPIVVFRHFTKAISKRMLNWIGVGRYSWINTDKSIFKYVNHSCEPNIALVTKRKVIALRTLPAGTELTMDYSLTESEPDWTINCECGTKSCRKKIGPVSMLPKKTFNKYKSVIPVNFQHIYQIDNA